MTFEEWAAEHDRRRTPYITTPRDIWDAAQRAAFERAAEECAKENHGTSDSDDVLAGALALRIRSLETR